MPSSTVSAQAGVPLTEIDYVVFYDKPFLKFERLLETYLAYAPRGLRSFQMAMPLWIREKLFQKTLLARRAKAAWCWIRLAAETAVRRTPPEPRGQRFLSVSVSRKR